MAFDLAFLDRMLILTCGFRNFFGDVGIDFVDGHDAVFVGIPERLDGFVLRDADDDRSGRQVFSKCVRHRTLN